MWRLALLVGASGWLVSASLMSPAGQSSAPKERVEFNRDIRPILGKCMDCHGPSSETGTAGLRLDSFKAATIKLPSGRTAVVPGKVAESELLKRIHATDGTMMPPASSHKKLSGEEKQLLADWIEQGAEYKEHWGFVTPVASPIPAVKNTKWPLGDIDRFILAKLESHGLQPENEADRATLLRRVSLDIAGLPPTPEELAAFEADTSKNAYEKVVDRLLASPRYGERMAMDWMDYARYADSNGYQADYERYQSRWRDWVINAFNVNMPYDQFTVEQIAGDLLPNPTMEQKLATAFNRNHRINTEGGVIAEEWRVEAVVDRVETTSAVWLGLTTGCARCHDHKYDPLTQKDFYQLFAFFNNVPESGTGEERPVNHPPLMKAPTPEQSSKLADLKGQLDKLEVLMKARLAANSGKAQNWTVEAPLPATPAGAVNRFAFDKDEPSVKLVGKSTRALGRASGSVVTSAEGYADLGDIADFERDQPFSFGAWIKPTGMDGAPLSRMESANAYRGWECSIAGGKMQAHLIHKWPENGAKIASVATIPVGRWVHLLVTCDGSSKAAGMKMYLDGKLAETTVENDTLKDTIRTKVSVKVGRRTDSDFFTGEVDDVAIFNRVLAAEEVAKLASAHPAARLLAVPTPQRTMEQAAEIARLWSLEHDASFAKLDSTFRPAAKEKSQLEGQIPDVMVMEEMPKPRDCFVLNRGQYDQPTEKVTAGLPSFLPPMPANLPNNRLGFAKWVVSKDNPLTARVTVNRLWERFFGQGFVSTVEDFGTRAEFPSHPELLDHLALRFQGTKWNLKAMVKDIVMSATYRQSSRFTEAKIAADPTNRLLARGSRYRLTGEVIRDQALFVSGLLQEKIGGPSVRPYQPAGVWDETNFYGNLRNYKHDKGQGLYRRSLYTIWKRTAAPPNMLLFDVPSREACRVQRARTDTPLQALTLMNDETYLEAARVLAQHMLRNGGSTPEPRLTYGFLRVLSRKPTGEELKIMTTALGSRLERFKRDPAAARDLTVVGDAPIDLGLDKAELAAYTVAASTLLNLDETVNKG